MIKDTINRNETVFPNTNEMKILKENFPSCFREDGSFDIERFKEYLSDKVTVSSEGYELKFLGKNYARLLASVDTTTVIVPDGEHNNKVENKDSQNIYISGDNLDGLKQLLKSYARQVKCIYIDPPYNTGSDGFVYNDNFNFTTSEIALKLSIEEEQAQRILDLTQRGSASHSAWLMFMYPRLLLARDLLTDDGVIFISIDDNEQGNLKLICDDVFGEENFIANIIIQANKRGQTYKQIAKTHEYLLVYTKNVYTELNELNKGEGAFDKQDNIGKFEERELRNRNPKFGRFNRPNLFFPIYTNPNVVDDCGYSPVSLEKSDEFNLEILPLNSENEESCWRWSKNKFSRFNNPMQSMESEVVAKKKSTGEYGCYEKYRKGTFKAKTIWYEEDLVGDLTEEDDDIWEETNVITEQGSKELTAYGMGDAFDFPKPTYLIKKIFHIGSNDGDICMDFFSGSGTSFEALMSLNVENDGRRKIIAVQLPENLDTKYESVSKNEKAKIKKVLDFLDSVSRPHTLDQVGLERIDRAVAKIKEAYPNTTTDLGFKHYNLQEPNQITLDKLETFIPEDQGMFLTNDILTDFGTQTVLTTWLVRDGYGFNASVETIDFEGYTGYYIDKHLYLIDADISKEAIAAIVDKYETDGNFNAENVVLFGYSFVWTMTEELKMNLARLKATEKNLRINFDVRY
ncbi:MAG: site-specific DNA-methyltransferase [Clostridium sp.]|nr:site-specific DNA-methyltransferase [Clostridium sp.]